MSTVSKLSDVVLVEKLQEGDKSALAELVKRWHKDLCDKAYWMVKDKELAKDIAQDSWTTIWNSIDKLKNKDRFKYWAFRIVYNKSIDVLRLKVKQQQFNDSNYKSIEILEEEDDKEFLMDSLLQAINALPEKQQMVVRLFYRESYSLKEISQILDISVGTTKSRLFHAREHLKQILKE